jgi:hypothetical protein
MMGPIIMQLVFKIFNMKRFSFLFTFTLYVLSLSNQIQAQVVPIGTMKLTNKLHTLSLQDLGSGPDNNWPQFRLKGIIQQQGSKAAIVENGFVFKEGDYGTNPDLQNAYRIVPVSTGTSDYTAIVGNFPQPSSVFGTYYAVRAYAKNSFGQVSYSNEYVILVDYNACAINPCKNGATCTSISASAVCSCTINYCGNCCAQLADPIYCPGGGEQLCPVASPIAYADNLDKNKFQNNMIKTTTFKNIWVNTGKAILDESKINTMK